MFELLFWHIALNTLWQFAPLPAPIDARATVETKALYAMLHRVGPNAILLGHQNAYIQGVYWHLQTPPIKRPDWQQLTGKAPAIAGFDFGNFKDTDGLPFHSFLAQVKMAHRDGAIITFSWHAYHPLSGRKPGPNDKDTRDAVAAILPGGSKHIWYRRQLDKIAAFANKARDDNGRPIPIILRLFHEQNGDWFWWSRTTAKRFKTLWRWTVSYLRDTRNIHQFLYAFSPSDQYNKRASRHYKEWFPGDKYVDIYGLDCYATHIQWCLPRIREMVYLAQKAGKPAALTETGQPTVASLQKHRTPWTQRFLKPIERDPIARNLAYAMFWRNATRQHRYLPAPTYGLVGASRSTRDFQRMVASTFVRETPAFRNNVAWLYASIAANSGLLSRQNINKPWAQASVTLTTSRGPAHLHFGQHNATLDAIWPTSCRYVAPFRSLRGSPRWVLIDPQSRWFYTQPNKRAVRIAFGRPPPAVTTKPIALGWVVGGSIHVAYQTKGQLYLVSGLQGMKRWRWFSLHQKLKRLPPVVGTPIAWTETHNATLHIASRTRSGHLLHLTYFARQRNWHWSIPTSRFPEKTKPTNRPSTLYGRADQHRRIFFRGRNGHIYTILRKIHKYGRYGRWKMFDLHIASGARVKAIGHLVGHSALWEQTQYILYRGPAKQLHALVYERKNKRWRYIPLSQRVGLTTPIASTPASFHWANGRSMHIIAHGSNGHLYEIWRERNRWHLTILTKANLWPRILGLHTAFQQRLPPSL